MREDINPTAAIGRRMTRSHYPIDTGRNPSLLAYYLAVVARLLPRFLRTLSGGAVKADRSKLGHNSFLNIPYFYSDRPFRCRLCGKRQIWKARDQKWYYEEIKGHIEARAVHCYDCRMMRKALKGNPEGKPL